MLKKKFIFIIIIGLSFIKVVAQEFYGLEKTYETIIEYDYLTKGSLTPMSTTNNKIAYYNINNNKVSFLLFNEEKSCFKQTLENLDMTYPPYFYFNIKNQLLFYCKLIFDSGNINDLGYNILFLNYKGKDYKLEQIQNSDKNIHSSFSQDGNLLLVNTLNSLSDRYDPTIDDQILVFYLDSLDADIIKKDFIPCKYCADSHLINEKLFFTISNESDDFDEGFFWKDIYIAPFENISDTIRIATRTELVKISSDGRYILGKRADLVEYPYIIIDTETKKYQYLIGRDYIKGAKPFYSETQQKFAFDFNGKIIYIDYPKAYPFDALKKERPKIPYLSNKEFYNQLRH